MNDDPNLHLKFMCRLCELPLEGFYWFNNEGSTRICSHCCPTIPSAPAHGRVPVGYWHEGYHG